MRLADKCKSPDDACEDIFRKSDLSLTLTPGEKRKSSEPVLRQACWTNQFPLDFRATSEA